MACPDDSGLSKMKKPSAVGWEVLGKKGHADHQPQSCSHHRSVCTLWDLGNKEIQTGVCYCKSH